MLWTINDLFGKALLLAVVSIAAVSGVMWLNDYGDELHKAQQQMRLPGGAQVMPAPNPVNGGAEIVEAMQLQQEELHEKLQESYEALGVEISDQEP